MPVPPTWMPRLAEILDTTRKLASNDLDRAQIMCLFGLKRRAALLLMKQLEPRKVRGCWRIDRARLAAWLEDQGRDAERERARRDRLTRALLAADISLPRRPGAFLSVSATQEMRRQAVQGLPPGVALTVGSPSRLEVEFETLAELAEKLLQAGLALDRNFDHYAALLETGDPFLGSYRGVFQELGATFVARLRVAETQNLKITRTHGAVSWLSAGGRVSACSRYRAYVMVCSL